MQMNAKIVGIAMNIIRSNMIICATFAIVFPDIIDDIFLPSFRIFLVKSPTDFNGFLNFLIILKSFVVARAILRRTFAAYAGAAKLKSNERDRFKHGEAKKPERAPTRQHVNISTRQHDRETHQHVNTSRRRKHINTSPRRERINTT
jgi:hypothetical protein